MQTFLPYSDFNRTASVLDYRRLGKQRIESKQILQLCLGETDFQWKHHPVVKMWKGYESALAKYSEIICIEWRNRGYKDVQLDIFRNYLNRLPPIKMPDWMGYEPFHKSHRQALLFKNFEHYSKFFVDDVAKLEYIWPSRLQLV